MATRCSHAVGIFVLVLLLGCALPSSALRAHDRPGAPDRNTSSPEAAKGGRYKAVMLQGFWPSRNSTTILRRLRKVLANYFDVLPPSWTFLIMYTPEAAWIQNASLGVPPERLEFHPTNKELTPSNWFLTGNRMFKLASFWKRMNADRVLYFEPDTVLCKNSSHTITDFLEWEYIGAPWLGPWFKEQQHLPEAQQTADWNVWQMWGGNGGLSLRSPQAMIACIKKMPPRNLYEWRLNEDKWFTKCLSKLKRKIAPWYIGRKFSSETYINVHSLGYHKPLLQDKPKYLVEQVLQRCPEFQGLHEYLDTNNLWQDEAVKTGKWFTKEQLQAQATPGPKQSPR